MFRSVAFYSIFFVFLIALPLKAHRQIFGEDSRYDLDASEEMPHNYLSYKYNQPLRRQGAKRYAPAFGRQNSCSNYCRNYYGKKGRCVRWRFVKCSENCGCGFKCKCS